MYTSLYMKVNAFYQNLKYDDRKCFSNYNIIGLTKVLSIMIDSQNSKLYRGKIIKKKKKGLLINYIA